MFKILFLSLLSILFLNSCSSIKEEKKINSKGVIEIQKGIYLKAIKIKTSNIFNFNDTLYIYCEQNGSILTNEDLSKNNATIQIYNSEIIPSIKENFYIDRKKKVYTFKCENLNDCENKIKTVKESLTE
jgi:hypothetical protein